MYVGDILHAGHYISQIEWTRQMEDELAPEVCDSVAEGNA